MRDPAAFWDEVYSEDAQRYGLRPNDFLVEQLGHLEPGRLLLPAEGEGRNAVWAAQQGWEVEAFDISAVAVRNARAFAAQHGASVRVFEADFGSPELEEAHYDAIALIYAHVPEAVRRQGLKALKRALRPGGSLIIEAFAPAHLELGAPCGPKMPAMLYGAEALRQELSGLEIWRLGEERLMLDAGKHAGQGVVLRVVARKPAEWEQG